MLKITKSLLKEVMINSNIKSFTELSKITGISRQTLTKYSTVNGISEISLSNLIKLCNSLKCNINDLIEISNNNSSNTKNELISFDELIDSLVKLQNKKKSEI